MSTYKNTSTMPGNLNQFLSVRMAALLNKFRIDYSDLIVITDLNKPPKESTRNWFDGLIRPFIRREELSGNTDNLKRTPTNFNYSINKRDINNLLSVTETERVSLQAKTDRHCRLRELVVDHSTDSNLVVMWVSSNCCNAMKIHSQTCFFNAIKKK